MATKKPTYSRRLRIVRRLNNGLTQASLARRVGYSEISVLKIEAGERKMTEAFAKKVAAITGVSWNWLLGREGKDSEPVNGLGRPYDPQRFEEKSRLRIREKLDPDGSLFGETHLLCHSLTDVLIAAYRKGHYSFVSESIRDLLKRMTNDFKLNSVMDTSTEQLERHVFSGDEYSADPGLRESLWRLFSPVAVTKWADASNGTATDRQDFLTELNSLYELVATSFVTQSEGMSHSAKIAP